MTLTSHHLRIQESNFDLYFLEVYLYVFLTNPSEKRSACPEEQPKCLFMFGSGSLGRRTNKWGVQQMSTKTVDNHLDEKLPICYRVQPTKVIIRPLWTGMIIVVLVLICQQQLSFQRQSQRSVLSLFQLCFCIQTVNQNVENWYPCVHMESFVCKEQFVSSREFFRLHTDELFPLPTQFVDVPTDFLICRILLFK